MGYLLLSLIKSKSPLFRRPATQGLHPDVLYERKVSIPLEVLCDHLPPGIRYLPEFTLYMKYVTSLLFDDDPDYDFCKRLFFDLLGELKHQGAEPQFQWLIDDKVSTFEKVSVKMFDSKKSKVVYCSAVDLATSEGMEAFKKLELNSQKQRLKKENIPVEEEESSDQSDVKRNPQTMQEQSSIQ